jgi:DNA-binding beta-propeller fold protein YncE
MPQLTHVVQLDDRPVVGLTSVDSRRLFVLRESSEQQIEVYETTTFKLQQTLNVVGLNNSSGNNGLTSCFINNCLYVSDFVIATVYKIELTGHNEISKWRVDGKWPTGLSINAACNLLVTCTGDRKLLEYTPSGSLVREIRLQSTSSPLHAIQLTSDQFVVCTSNLGRDSDVVEVNLQGRVVTSYKNQLQSTTRHQFNYPRHLAVDKNNECIFVADWDNARIVMLSRSLKCAREFNASVDGSRYKPWCLYLNQSNSRLYVDSYEGLIFVFDIRRHYHRF